MKVTFRITKGLLKKVHHDLDRKHRFTAERVGFIACKASALPDNGLLILARDYFPVEDDDYMNDPRVGAMMGSNAIRKAMQVAYSQNLSLFHVHRHEHRGLPSFSPVDLTESAKFVPDFWNVQPTLPHGTIVLSHDQLNGLCWMPGTRNVLPFTDMTVVTSPLVKIWRS